MAEITVNLTEDLQRFVEGQVNDGGYGDAGEYIARLLARAKQGKQEILSIVVDRVFDQATLLGTSSTGASSLFSCLCW